MGLDIIPDSWSMTNSPLSRIMFGVLEVSPTVALKGDSLRYALLDANPHNAGGKVRVGSAYLRQHEKRSLRQPPPHWLIQIRMFLQNSSKLCSSEIPVKFELGISTLMDKRAPCSQFIITYSNSLFATQLCFSPE